MKKMLTSIKTLFIMVQATKAEFKRRVRENRATLIKGSILDPENHPSYNK